MLKRPRGVRNWKHGYADSPIYKVWQSMRDRCNNPKASGYENYGGRGIRVCHRWDESFEAFLVDMGERPTSAHSIERKNNDGHYEPSNCRWATKREQNNNSRNCRILEHNGIRDTTVGWAKRLGCSVNVLRTRLFLGWTDAEALTPPFERNHAKRNSKRYELWGQTLTIPEWAARTGIPRTTIGMRLRSGWTLEDALTRPVRDH